MVFQGGYKESIYTLIRGDYMSYTSKKIICLAKSRRPGGFNIAGKELLDDGSVGGWIRPVSSRETQEISSEECRYKDDSRLSLLDIIEIPFIKHQPRHFQGENFLIDDNYRWVKEDTFDFSKLLEICDNPDALWTPHDSSSYGMNDRVEERFMDILKGSLYLITPGTLSIDVQSESREFGNPRRKVRVSFEYNGVTYIFPITDPTLEKQNLSKRDGRYPVNNPKNRIFMCVSIELPQKSYCNKAIDSILEQ